MKLFPQIDPYDQGYLNLSDLHSIYYEQSGNPKGVPVLYLHGGPGDGADPKHRTYFNPEKFRIIIFDQRGSGRNKPLGELKHNNTKELVDDIEKLRKKLGVDQMILAGGSWGSTLALNYAISYPKRVNKMVLWAIALFSEEEYEWSLKHGANVLFPDKWEQYFGSIENDIIHYYYKLATSKDELISKQAIADILNWNLNILSLEPSNAVVDSNQIDARSLAAVKIYIHYLQNKGFMEKDQILEGCSKIEAIPCKIIHGRYDMLTPVISAWQLHKRLPNSDLEIVIAGHRTSEPKIISSIIRQFK